MKAVLILCALALFAMVAAKPQGVNVVDNNPEAVNVVDYNPDQSQVHVVDNNPSAVHVVNNNPGYRPGNEPIDISPAFVQPEGRPYGPAKPNTNPYARLG